MAHVTTSDEACVAIRPLTERLASAGLVELALSSRTAHGVRRTSSMMASKNWTRKSR
jgi:hypothetical protein